jgi:hypothetical protein
MPVRQPKTPRDYVTNPCPSGEHDIRKSFEKCGRCGCDLCTLCGSDLHFVSDGHNLNDPRYWGV